MNARLAIIALGACVVAAAAAIALLASPQAVAPDVTARRLWTTPHGTTSQRAAQRIAVARQIYTGAVLEPGSTRAAVLALLGKPGADTVLPGDGEELGYLAGTVSTPSRGGGYDECSISIVLKLRQGRVYGKPLWGRFCSATAVPFSSA